ncbi:MAG: outer membrane protein assembly factor BamD [Bacteroidota bacterium]|nr:outer membrane protein assembly factor BamD [Bacteroidota bacterium]MDP4237441.1 outer membrane protein assembly factor BamD [Bacteroidota bacterium]
MKIIEYVLDSGRQISSALLVGLLLILNSCGGSKPAAQVAVNNVIESRFAEGKAAYAKEDWLEAIHIFDEIRLQAPTSSFAIEATYLEAMARYNSGTYISAAVDFRAVRRNYPTSSLAARSQFMVGESYYMLSPRAELDQTYSQYAINEYQLFLRDFSDKPLADSAQMRIGEIRNKMALKVLLSAELYLKLSSNNAAIRFFNRVVDNYYDTPSGIEAQLRIAEVQYARKKMKEAQDAILVFEEKFFSNATPAQRARARSIKQSLSLR